MDVELLAERLAATESAVLRIDQRLDATESAIAECQTLLTSLSDQTSTNDLVSRLAILEGERQVAQEERLAAEAAAMEAQAEAVEAEAEAMQAMAEAEEELAEEEAPETTVEIIETEEPEEAPPPKESNRNELEELTSGR